MAESNVRIVQPVRPTDAQIRDFLRRNPDALRDFLRREEMRRPRIARTR